MSPFLTIVPSGITLSTVEAPPPVSDCPLALNSRRSSSHSITVRRALSILPPVVRITSILDRRTEVVTRSARGTLAHGFQLFGRGNARVDTIASVRTTPTLESPNDQRDLDRRTI